MATPTMRRYEVSVKGHEDEFHTVVTALTSGKAKYDYYLSLQAASYPFGFQHLRCRSLGVIARIRPADESERRQLEILRHALGLDHIGLNKQGGQEGYRNYYALNRGSADFDLLMSMCEGLDKGRLPLMGRRDATMLAEGLAVSVTVFAI